jgi:hypothetical protein
MADYIRKAGTLCANFMFSFADSSTMTDPWNPCHPWLPFIDAALQFLTCHSQAQPVRVRIVNRNRLTCFWIFVVLFCCIAVQLKAGEGGEYRYGAYRESSYRAVSSTVDSQLIFRQMIEQRDIKYAINTLIGEGFTSSEIQDAVQNRLLRIRGWHWPQNACSASGKIGEPGEGTVVGPTYYLIIGRARILRWIHEVGSS